MNISGKSLYLALAVLIAVLLASGVLAFEHTRRLRDDALWVAHTQEVLAAVETTLDTTVEAETGQRGYLLTSDPGYLKPYQAAVAKVQANLRRLQDLVRDNPSQLPRIQALDKLIAAKLEELKRTIALQDRDPAAARRLVLTHLGRNLMDSIRAEVDGMTAEEQALLAQRRQSTRASYRTAAGSGALFALLGLALTVGFLLQLRGHLRERAGHEQALDRQRQWLQVTLRSIGDALIATDGAGAVVFMNPVAEALTGWPAREAVGRPLEQVFAIVNEQTRAAAPNPAARVLREGIVVGLANHTALVARDGREIPIEDSAAPILEAAGNVSGVVLVFHDVTGKRRTEEELRENEERFRTAFDRGPVPMVMSAVDGRFLRVNPAFAQMLGYSVDELERSTAWTVTHPDDVDSTRAGLDAVSRGGTGFRQEKRYRRKDGTYIWGDMATAAVPDAQGRTQYLLTYVQDITERKRVEQELRDANRRKDEFLGTLAHELRNPLAPIRTGAYLLGARPAPDPETRQIHEMIARQAAHMARLVDDLLQVSRIEQGKLELRKERTDLGQLLAHAVEACRPAIESRGHHLALTVPDPAPALEADPIRLEQMVANLVNNACKCTPPGGHLQVWAERDGGEVEVGVRDDGVGLAPGEIEHIFDLFYQVGPAGAHAEAGLGIGLTLVQRLAQLHGGTVTAASEGPGKGSEFRLRLPTLEPLPPVPAPAEVPAPRGRRKHVLIVDDDASVRTMSAMLLKAQDYEVTTAATGEKGVEKARALRPDIALIDLGMPGMDGCEVASRIRAELGRAIYLVALTGFSREEDLTRTRAVGFDRHLVKSGDPRELLQLLSEVPR